MTQPLVSVVMPTYDRPEYLQVALESVLGQTLTDLEVVVADDGPNPATEELVRSYGDERIRYFRNPLGIDALQNSTIGFGAASGRFVAGLHDDDFWLPGFLEACVTPMLDGDLDAAFCDVWVVDGVGERMVEASDDATREAGRDGLAPGRHHPWAGLAMAGTVPMQLGVVVRNGLADWATFPREVAGIFDRWFAYETCRHGGDGWYVAERLVCSRETGENQTALYPLRWSTAGAWCHERFLEDPALVGVRDVIRAKAAEYRYVEAVELLRAGARADARRSALRSLAHHPGWRAGSVLAASVAPPALVPRRLR